jgi:hypothetical protein
MNFLEWVRDSIPYLVQQIPKTSALSVQ